MLTRMIAYIFKNDVMPALDIAVSERLIFQLRGCTYKTPIDMATLIPIFSFRRILLTSKSRVLRLSGLRNIIQGNMAKAISMTPEYAATKILYKFT